MRRKTWRQRGNWWQPGTGHGYHVNTFGYLGGELIRRITGATVGEFLRGDVAGPLGADVHIGLTAAEHGRVAEFRWPDRGEARAAFALWPTSMRELLEISDAGQIMPPKSTWFEPKLRSGLFLHPF